MDYLREINTISIIFRLLLATLFSGIIGFERGTKKRPAGFRTHILVCIGATMVMITSQYMIDILKVQTDPTRLGAQVISGIGFLGAGTIIVIGRNQVKGLTTAAGLWTCACIGLAIGVGFYEGAIICGLFLYGVLVGLHRLDEYVEVFSTVMEIYVELESMSALSRFIEHVKEQGTKVSDLEIQRIKQDGNQTIGAMMTLTLRERCDHTQYLFELHHIEGIRAIQEIG